MTAAQLAFLRGGGTLGRLIRTYDWASTPLGVPELWPQSLRSALSICLHSSFPTAIYWGSELRLLYNDAWALIPAERHPWALGRPGAEVWADIWPIVGPQFHAVMETGEGFSTFDQMLPMVRDGVTRETYWNYSFTPIRGENGAVAGVLNQGNETTAAVLAHRSASAEIDRLGRMFAQAPGAIAILRGPAHEFEIVNSAYENLVGRRNLTGKTVRDALPEVNAQGFIALLDSVFAGGKPYVGRAVPVLLHRGPDGQPEQRYVDFVYQPLFDATGACSGIFVQATDVSEQQRSAEARQLLLHEMNHRVKNLFAIASGLVTMTARTAPSVPDMAQALRDRLMALASAHDLVGASIGIEGSQAQTTLRSLLEAVLKPLVADPGGGFGILDGPAVALGEKSVTALALTFHELATNAAKYGGLRPSGTLRVRWRLGGGAVHLEWIETIEGEHLVPPTALGFGSRLARTSITDQLGGTIDFDWRREGLSIAIVVPEEQLRA